MKIGQCSDQPLVATGTTPAAEATASVPARDAAAGAAKPDASAKVELSSAADVLLASGGAEFDAEKVGRIGAAIANGTFSVNADAIADKLIANAKELISRVKG